MSAQCDVDPGRTVQRPRRLAARATLQEKQVRQVVILLAGIDELAREDVNRGAVRCTVVKRDSYDVLARYIAW
jgi:hypothetical protein